MSEESAAPVDLVCLWHHHQPDYRHPKDGRALLPWVRLHATKDYLDMALRLERHPRIRSAFNFVPSLLDQIEAAAGGAGDTLFDLIRRPVSDLNGEERREVVARCTGLPRYAAERWPAARKLIERAQRARQTNGSSGEMTDEDVLGLETWFLLAWLDPWFHSLPEAAAAIAARGAFAQGHRDDVLALHDRPIGEVIPAYRRLAEAGQVELSASPYYHPILPLLVDLGVARRARPDLSLPSEPFAVPEDAARQVNRALERHARAFGVRPAGMWPPEGSVSPETVEIAARAGLRWLATDEGVLWPSLPQEARKREALYRPWRFETPGGEVTLLFRDRELSDRIGFVYYHWEAAQAVADFVERVRRIGREHRGAGTPVVSVILDGENCWEHYPDDGGPFLDRLYQALEAAPDIRTRTPSEVVAEGRAAPLVHLHSGSWINADFRIWIGHPEKNRAWELLARARRALVERDAAAGPAAWEALTAAEGSDWFWWFGDDHHTPDKAVFDLLFREHLRGAYERSGVTPPGWLEVPIASLSAGRDTEHLALGFVHPTVDGERTGFYEWHAAGRHRLDARGSSMHRSARLARDLYFGFDAEWLFLRVDFTASKPPGAGVDLGIELLAPRQARFRVEGLEPGERPVRWEGGERNGEQVAGATCRIQTILELAIPFTTLGLKPGERVEILGHLVRDGNPIETLPAEQLLRFTVPDAGFEATIWSA